MYKIEKEIIINENMEQPNVNVLEKARSAMINEKPRRRINSRQIFALASSIVVILVLVICIPFMMPAHNEITYVYNDSLKSDTIESISAYNDSEKLNILHFDTYESSQKYVYEGSIVFIEEHSIFDDTNIKLLVKFNSNCKGLSFQKEEEYTVLMSNMSGRTIANTVMMTSVQSDKVCLTFTQNDYSYYVCFSGEVSNWETIIKNFLA